MALASSARVRVVRRLSFQACAFRLISASFSALTPGRKPVNDPFRFLWRAFAGPESVPEERERYDLIDATSPSVLAVRYLRLAGMEFQPDLGQPVSDRRPHLAGLAFGDAVHDHIICIAFE